MHYYNTPKCFNKCNVFKTILARVGIIWTHRLLQSPRQYRHSPRSVFAQRPQLNIYVMDWSGFHGLLWLIACVFQVWPNQRHVIFSFTCDICFGACLFCTWCCWYSERPRWIIFLNKPFVFKWSHMAKGSDSVVRITLLNLMLLILNMPKTNISLWRILKSLNILVSCFNAWHSLVPGSFVFQGEVVA